MLYRSYAAYSIKGESNYSLGRRGGGAPWGGWSIHINCQTLALTALIQTLLPAENQAITLLAVGLRDSCAGLIAVGGRGLLAVLGLREFHWGFHWGFHRGLRDVPRTWTRSA